MKIILLMIIILTSCTFAYDNCSYNIKVKPSILAYTTTDGSQYWPSNYSNPYKQGDIFYIQTLTLSSDASFPINLSYLELKITKPSGISYIVCSVYSKIELVPHELNYIVCPQPTTLDEAGLYHFSVDSGMALFNSSNYCNSNESIIQSAPTGGLILYLNKNQLPISTFYVLSIGESKSLEFSNAQKETNDRMEWLTKVLGLFTILIGIIEIIRFERENRLPLRNALLSISNNILVIKSFYLPYDKKELLIWPKEEFDIIPLLELRNILYSDVLLDKTNIVISKIKLYNELIAEWKNRALKKKSLMIKIKSYEPHMYQDLFYLENYQKELEKEIKKNRTWSVILAIGLAIVILAILFN